MGKVKFGWSEVDITPKENIALRGQFYERVSKEVETPISVTALAMEADGEQAVFCACDLVCVDNCLVDLARQKITAKGLDPMKVIFSATHTHTAYSYGYHVRPTEKKEAVSSLTMLKNFMPDGCEYIPADSDPNQMDTEKALFFLADKLAEAVDKAWAARKPGLYANAFGRAAVGMNRRVCYADGKAKMWGDVDSAAFTFLEGGNDSGIELMFTYDENQKLTGVIANIACPAQVMEQRFLISSDYWGKVKILLREQYGEDLFLLALCAPAGDQCPRDLVRWIEPETPILDPNVIRVNPKARRADPSMYDVNGTWTIGRRIVSEVAYAIDNVTELHTDAVMRHVAKKIGLPLRRVTETDKINAEKTIREFFKDKKTVNYIDTADMHVNAGILIRYQKQETENLVETEVHDLRFGDVAFATNPFELFLDFGNLIRARSVAKQTFLIQLACGSFGYLPTEKAEKGGHYSAYVASGYVGHEGGNLLVRDTLDEINKMFKD